MEILKISEQQQKLLDAPLPAEAVSPHPTKSYLSSIKAIYVTERLNQVFGVGSWRVRSEQVARDNKMVSSRSHLRFPSMASSTNATAATTIPTLATPIRVPLPMR